MTGEPDAQPIYVAIGSRAWTVDLAANSLAKLEAALAPFLANAVPVKASKSTRATTPAARAKPVAKDAAAVAERARVRAWA